ncbi:unnamed protein product [Moneuplotes crassus]|uniref:DUF1499 domain-containing protein n=1 Tax=Euplotes crassus TaxID=5936 RepID=A0AAD1XRA1_EUPCR|nr:unnamed protein product [Moneuplotes crassus]
MQTIKVKDYNDKKGVDFKKRLVEYWKTLQKTNMQYLFIVLFIQIINLILILLIIQNGHWAQYVWGFIVHLLILTIVVSFLMFKWLRKQKCILFMTVFVTPAVLLSFIIIVLLVGFKPSSEFPNHWRYSDNNFSRMATVDKFRVSEIELKYPVTFKMEVDDLKEAVDDWMRENGFNANPEPIIAKTPPLKASGDDVDIIGYSFSFSYFDFKTLFGMVNDLHIRVIECSDVWGGVKLEAHSNIRLGLKDYGTNIKFISSLYKYIEERTTKYNRSKLLCEDRS